MAGSGGRRRCCPPASASSSSRRARSAGEATRGGVASPLAKRRSERNVASPAPSLAEAKARLTASRRLGSPRPAPFVMQPITLRKIVPRNRQVKETASTPRRSPRISVKDGKENICQEAHKGKSPGGGHAKRTPGLPSSRSCALNPEAGTLSVGKQVLSPIAGLPNDSPPGDQRDLTMAKRVRRSYSRLEVSLAHSFLDGPSPPRLVLSDTSTPNHEPEKRQTLFGFEKILAAGGEADGWPPDPEAPRKLTCVEGEAPLEPDPNIPGISLMKERRKKKKMPQFNELQLDEWVAQMNAEFDEAEKFDLLVE